MPQAKVYQIERLKTKVRNSFEETRNAIQPNLTWNKLNL
jgi:hypothetical protein